jgi:hypothetical protein
MKSNKLKLVGAEKEGRARRGNEGQYQKLELFLWTLAIAQSRK